MRKLISSGSPFEAQIGFSRAVRVGSLVAVAGTAPIAVSYTHLIAGLFKTLNT